MRAARGAFVQVLVAVPSARLAADLSRRLLQQRLCACAQTLGPVTSRYRWQGEVEQAREWLLLLKTRTALLSRLEREIRRQHGASVTLVALTGWGQEADRRRALDSGFDYHLVKPVDPNTLNELLAEVGKS